jgi:uncharacterized protein (DUF433 family)
MNWSDRITLDAAVPAGKPVIRGSRLAVDFIVGLLGQGWTEADILRNYPGITHDDIAACLQYASEILQSEKVYPVAIAWRCDSLRMKIFLAMQLLLFVPQGTMFCGSERMRRALPIKMYFRAV